MFKRLLLASKQLAPARWTSTAVEGASQAPSAVDKGQMYLEHLKNSNGPLYALIEMKGRPYHLTQGDMLTVPRLSVPLGAAMMLDRVREIGGAQITIRGNPYVDTKIASVSAVVVEHWLSPKRVTIKKKRRKGYRRAIGHRQHLTSLRITQVELQTPQ